MIPAGNVKPVHVIVVSLTPGVHAGVVPGLQFPLTICPEVFELDASKRKFDNVLFWAMDRFSREGIEATLAYIRQLDSYKVGWKSYQEPFFASAGPFKEFMVAAFATFARLEKARISERTLAGLAKAREQGRVGGRPKATDDYKLISKVCTLRNEGKSIRLIAAELGIATNTVMKLLAA